MLEQLSGPQFSDENKEVPLASETLLAGTRLS